VFKRQSGKLPFPGGVVVLTLFLQRQKLNAPPTILCDIPLLSI